jgi:hypothetical protein
MNKHASSVLLFAAFAITAAAADKPEPAVNADTKERFATVSSWVQQEMRPGGRYEHITSSERSTVEAKLAEMGGLLDKHGTVAEMNDTEKTEMFNSQEQVNAILTKRDGDRLICKSVAPVGSHIPVTTCRTARQMESEQRDARTYIEDPSRNVQLKSGN